jgi:O-antigen ligase
VRLLSPAAHERWAAALGSAGPLPWLPLSLDPLATVREFFRFCACAAFYVLTVQLLARRERLRAVTTVLAILAAALSFEALLQFLVAPGRLLFIRTSPSQFSFGPFVNRNHYANLMAMLAPVVFGLYLGRGTRGAPRTLRHRLVNLLARPESGVRLLLGFAALLSAGSLVISLSRGATLAVVAALLVFGGCLIAHRLGRRRSVAAALFFYAFTVFVGWFGWERVADRFSSLRANPDIVDAVRAGLWRDTVRLASDFPLVGAGVGSFDRVYPGYRTVTGPHAIAHAHNDYLELLAGGGALGAGLFLWFVGAVLLSAALSCRSRREPSALYLAFGSLAGCVAFLVHGASDFSLAIGANALYFFFLLGLAVAASRRTVEEAESEALRARRRLTAQFSRVAAALAFVAVLAHGCDLAARRAWSLADAEGLRAGALRVPPPSVIRLIVLASRCQPLDPAYPAALARIAVRDGDAEEALLLTRRALRLLPVDAGALMQSGTLLAARGEDEPARQIFAAAVAADPAAAQNRERFGAWLLSRGDRVAGLAQVREALALDPERASGIFSMLVLAGFDDERIAAVVPPSTAVLLRFARYATTTGATRLAAETYKRVLAIDPENQEAFAGLRSLAPPR